MLKRCIAIENIENNNYGIMNDKPGTGKTYVIISLIYETLKNNSTNIIIVPQNIYSQWCTSIEKYSKKISYKNLLIMITLLKYIINLKYYMKMILF